MASLSADQTRLLGRLAETDTAVSYAQLAAAGVRSPALVVAELELQGYQFERVRWSGHQSGIRLLVAPGAVERSAQRWLRRPGRPD